jgi:transcriptional regulator with XRE-family HTH domain
MARRVESPSRECAWRELIRYIEHHMATKGYKYGPADLARDAGMPLSTLSGMLNCYHKPSLETLTKLSRHLREPLEKLQELAGERVVPMGDIEITDPNLTLNMEWRRLTPEQQAAVRAMIRHFLSTRP